MTTWESPKEQIFEMPTGGAAIMRKGPNLLKFARKEQCLALTTQLRTKFKLTPCFYRRVGCVAAPPRLPACHPRARMHARMRPPPPANAALRSPMQPCPRHLHCTRAPCRVYADGKVEYLHPKDGVYPEKVNAGRVGQNQNFRNIGENVDPIKVRGGRGARGAWCGHLLQLALQRACVCAPPLLHAPPPLHHPRARSQPCCCVALPTPCRSSSQARAPSRFETLERRTHEHNAANVEKTTGWR